MLVQYFFQHLLVAELTGGHIETLTTFVCPNILGEQHFAAETALSDLSAPLQMEVIILLGELYATELARYFSSASFLVCY